jgi:hypothetical protein
MDQIVDTQRAYPLITRIDPQLIRDDGTPGQIAMNPVRTDWSAKYSDYEAPAGSINFEDIYDPRFNSYGDGERAYSDINTGQVRYYYSDVDAYRMPNFIQRSNVDFVDFTIGSQLIDRQYGEWMAIWCDLTYSTDKSQVLDDMIMNTNDTLYIPLQLWFCRNPGLALPLIALQYHDVKIIIKFRNFDDLWTFGPNNYYVASQTGTTVTSTSGPLFDELDQGKIIYWADGTTSNILPSPNGFDSQYHTL